MCDIILSLITPELLVTSFSKQTFEKQNISDQDIAYLDDIINPILQAEYSIIKDSDIKSFAKKCQQIFQEFYKDSTLDDISKQSLGYYQTCLLQINQSSLTTQNKFKLHRIIYSLKDFILIMTSIFKRCDNLENIFDQGSYDNEDDMDFEKALYGTIFSLICVFFSMDTSNDVNPNSLSILINQGCDFASALCGYTDTFDILSNPVEREFMQNQNIET